MRKIISNCQQTFNYSLEFVYSNEKCIPLIIIPSAVLGAINLIPLGHFFTESYRYFFNKKITWLKKELHLAIENGDNEKVQKIFENYPILKNL